MAKQPSTPPRDDVPNRPRLCQRVRQRDSDRRWTEGNPQRQLAATLQEQRRVEIQHPFGLSDLPVATRVLQFAQGHIERVEAEV